MLGTIVPQYYKPGQVVYVDDPAMLPAGCHYERYRPPRGAITPAVVSYRVVCDGGLIIGGRKIPDWLLGGAAIVAGLLVARFWR